MENYNLLTKVGKGAFGEVWKAERKDNPGKIIALKILPIKTARQKMVAGYELEMLEKISKPECVPNLACYYRHTDDDKNLYIEMEYIEGQNLLEFAKLHKDDPKLGAHFLAILGDLFPALIYLHSNNIIHRDIKPDNILIDENFVPKLIDVGLACIFPDKVCKWQDCCEGRAGTAFFMSPETLIRSLSYPESDVWSLGASIYKAYTRRNLFQPFPETFSELIKEVEKKDVPKLESNNEKLNLLVASMLEKDNAERITPKEALNFIKN